MSEVGRRRVGPLLAATAADAAVTAALVRRMEREYETKDSFTAPTVGAMYLIYATNAGLFAWALSRRAWPLPVPAGIAAAARIAVAMGGLLALAGMGRFESAAQISGTTPGRLQTSGIYRFSRNPQYLGLTVVLGGAALARRSGFGALLAAGAAATYRRWVRAEEQHLVRLFGSEYEAYVQRTSRWIGVVRRSHKRGAAVPT